MKKLLLIFLCLPMIGFGQGWEKTFGGADADYARSVQQTTDGGYIIAGSTHSFGNGDTDTYLIKTDGNGVEEWYQIFGGANDSYAASVQQTTDGGYIIAGRITNPGTYDVYLIKTDVNGVEQWNKKFGGPYLEFGFSVQQTTDGGYIIAGSTQSFGNGASDAYLIKTDGNGNITSTFNIPINPNRKLEKVVDILGKDIKPKTNTPLIEIYDDGTVEKRIVID